MKVSIGCILARTCSRRLWGPGHRFLSTNLGFIDYEQGDESSLHRWSDRWSLGSSHRRILFAPLRPSWRNSPHAHRLVLSAWLNPDATTQRPFVVEAASCAHSLIGSTTLERLSKKISTSPSSSRIGKVRSIGLHVAALFPLRANTAIRAKDSDTSIGYLA